MLLAAFLAFALWPRPTPVETAVVDRGTLRVEIVDEGRTRYHDVYVVSAPVAGRVLRVDVDPGDEVKAGATLAQMTPTAAGFLDPRSDREARAAVEAASAALRAAQARADLAEREYARTARLREDRLVADAALDQARTQLDADRAALASARAEVERARSALLQPAARGGGTVAVRAPATGVVLRVPQESEAVVPAGAPLVEIGDPSRIEVVAEFLSQDAVKMQLGAAATIEGWGGPPLAARVERIEPLARTKISALGVEEQRTNVILEFVEPAEARRLGHDYRVDARVVVEEIADAVRVPLGALFRDGGDWAAFKVEDGRATLAPVQAGPADDAYRVVRGGLAPGDRVIVYPGSGIADGARVEAAE
ncbi:MAG: efflux RND transporter periplasmic adaptor subunit [Steroidobacteraceae bacterium]|nr:efflux RND transporter periplasmic adaptor subunit [Steroidobacteraceae bacterium]